MDDLLGEKERGGAFLQKAAEKVLPIRTQHTDAMLGTSDVRATFRGEQFLGRRYLQFAEAELLGLSISGE